MLRSIIRIPSIRLPAPIYTTSLKFSTDAINSETIKNTSRVAISKSEFTPLLVSANKTLGKNVHEITLTFPQPTDILGMETAGMVMVQGEKRDGTGIVARPYTPTSRNDTQGRVELVVKDYPNVGNVSSHICRAKVGEYLSVKGCFPKISVKANKWKKVGMIAGGSGITPCLQVVEELLSLPEDTTEITLLFCNKDPGSVFLRDRIDSLVAGSDGRFTAHYCVDDAGGEEWSGPTGYVTVDMVRTYLPSADGLNNMMMVCGPPPLYDTVSGPKLFEEGQPPKQGEVLGILKEMGFTKDAVFKF